MTSQLVPVLIAAAALVLILKRLRRQRRARSTASPGHHPRLWPDRSDGSPALGVIGLVAGREIRQRIRGRSFQVATALLLAGVAAAVVIPVNTRGGPARAQQVGVVGAITPALRQAAATAATAAKTAVHVVSEADTAAAEHALRSGPIDVAVVDGGRLMVNKALTSGDTSTRAQFVRAFAQLLGVNRAFAAAGLSATQAQLLSSATPLPVASLQPASTNTAARTTSVIGVVVLFLMLTQYLTWTLIGVMEEKTSRVIEVLLASVRPLQLLTGKLVGIAAVVFAQAVLVAAVALVLARAVGSDLLHGSAPLALLSAVVWLVLGYAFYSWLYAAAGSMAERQDQVQSLAIPLALPLIAGYILSIGVASSGTAPTYFHVLAYLPPTAPFAMTTLVGLGAVTWWQFTLSGVLTAASTVALARLAATVYRRSILRTGRRVRLREVITKAR